MADDAGVGEQPGDILLAESRHLVEIEAGEALPEILALAEDRQPGQARLEALEADLLEQAEIVGDRTPPFAVMIDGIVRRARAPEAALLAVLAGHQGFAFRHGRDPCTSRARSGRERRDPC